MPNPSELERYGELLDEAAKQIANCLDPLELDSIGAGEGIPPERMVHLLECDRCHNRVLHGLKRIYNEDAGLSS